MIVRSGFEIQFVQCLFSISQKVAAEYIYISFSNEALGPQGVSRHLPWRNPSSLPFSQPNP